MVSAVNHEAYGNPAWGNAWGDNHPPWSGGFWHQFIGSRPFWIALMILGFIAWWPVGLALLFFLLGSGRMGCGMSRRHGAAQGAGWQGWGGHRSGCRRNRTEQQAPTSGNRAFDEYRAEALRRLEEEQREFAAFLDRLRFAKDKAEFDEFMTSRRQPPATTGEPPMV
jgi:hypothetical protein